MCPLSFNRTAENNCPLFSWSATNGDHNQVKTQPIVSSLLPLFNVLQRACDELLLIYKIVKLIYNYISSLCSPMKQLFLSCTIMFLFEKLYYHNIIPDKNYWHSFNYFYGKIFSPCGGSAAYIHLAPMNFDYLVRVGKSIFL